MNYVRRLPKFEYLAPQTVQEVCALLAQYGENAAIIAGGTDLLPKMKRRETVPQHLISLENIPGLDRIEYSDADGLRIGPAVTMHSIRNFPVIREKFGALAQAAADLGSAQIRNLATLAGNLCNTAPCADTPPALIAMGARLKLVHAAGERTVPIEEFFLEPFKSTRKNIEFLAEIQVPAQAPGSRGVYLRHTLRGAMEYPLVGVAVLLDLEGQVCRDIKVAGSVCSHCWRREGCKFPCGTPFRATRTEEVLRGKKLDDTLIQEAAQIAAKQARPLVNTNYARDMIKVFTRRAVTLAWKGSTQLEKK
ncbi:MAG: xanthine dehydrogenase family protein subunit M [Desulfobacterales bacterium]|nr:xanthine dehydrogenase family protein subunit M [Desulfobacterales bacterium]